MAGLTRNTPRAIYTWCEAFGLSFNATRTAAVGGTLVAHKIQRGKRAIMVTTLEDLITWVDGYSRPPTRAKFHARLAELDQKDDSAVFGEAA